MCLATLLSSLLWFLHVLIETNIALQLLRYEQIRLACFLGTETNTSLQQALEATYVYNMHNNSLFNYLHVYF